MSGGELESQLHISELVIVKIIVFTLLYRYI